MGWVIQGVGSLLQAGSQKKAGERADADAKTQQNIANYQAADALNTGSLEEQRYRRQIAQMLGTQKAEVGARNVTMSGSALSLLQDTGQLGEEDITTIRNNAARQAWGYKNQASEAARIGGAAVSNANASAGSSLLTGLSNAYGSWKQSKS